MSSVPVLYHAEASFYSQRARLSFAEKGIKYKSHVINLMAGEVHEEWFLRKINPKGQVPAMEHQGQFYRDSCDIIEYVDTLPSNKPKLCPDDSSDMSKKVGYYREKTGIHQCFCRLVWLIVPPSPDCQRLGSRFTAVGKNLTSLQEKSPDLVAGLSERKGNTDIIFDEEKVIAILNDVDGILGKSKRNCRNRKRDAEYWLCGKTFTIADIYLSCLLHRLTFVGQAERLFLSKRPLVTDYYNRVLLRKSFRKECVYANNMFWSMFMPMLRAKVKKARPFLFVVSAIAIGVIAYYKKEEIIDLGNEMFVKFRSLFPEVDTD
ncbi:ganglioside-induced differentiation-associated protein 1 [Strongylocentrotus purpuratus]|uniref:Ganglioside-induced differentiation-associated protein 1 n=1 Tax=Strongylocentrotus purpuratus TaxID=7668 RepID=A0A7M7NP64_STRPU|nr:ganglioside-induced differentiation-associated protein 1 [Strongylocentrotus purpuratus]